MKTIVFDSCGQCPFAARLRSQKLMCGHPSAFRERGRFNCRDLHFPPKWCPLRAEHTLIRLTQLALDTEPAEHLPPER